MNPDHLGNLAQCPIDVALHTVHSLDAIALQLVDANREAVGTKSGPVIGCRLFDGKGGDDPVGICFDHRAQGVYPGGF